MDFSDQESYVLVNPKQVAALEQSNVSVNEETSSSAKLTTGTRLVVHGEVYFVPMMPEKLATALGMEVIDVPKPHTRRRKL